MVIVSVEKERSLICPTCWASRVTIEFTEDELKLGVDVPHDEALRRVWSSIGRRSVTPKKVIFNAPATIVYWTDGTKTVVKCDERDTYSREAGLALCYMKKALGNKGNFNEVLKRWVSEANE